MPLFGSTPIEFGDTGEASPSPARSSSEGFSPSVSSVPSTVIAKGVKLEGEFKGQGDILIEGSVHGTLQTDGELTVGPDAEVHAGITAADAVIAGVVEGDVKVRNRLEIKATAHVTGDLSCEMIVVEAGAQLKGNLSCCGAVSDSPSSVLESSLTKNVQHPVTEEPVSDNVASVKDVKSEDDTGLKDDTDEKPKDADTVSA